MNIPFENNFYVSQKKIPRMKKKILQEHYLSQNGNCQDLILQQF
jgi:hypothetical protein